LGSCGTRKFLQDGEYLLKKNAVVFDSKEKIDRQKALSYELQSLFKQKPNTKALRLIRANLWWYYKTDSLDNPNKFQKFIRRRIAEPPALFDTTIYANTANTMQYYLQNKGYYDAEVKYTTEVNKNRKTAEVTYVVNPKRLYTIDSVSFISGDPKVQRILNDSEEETFLKKGEPVSELNYNREVNRIISTLRNLGFAYFDKNDIDELTADSTGTKVDIDLNILNPRNENEHKIYRVGKVTVNPNYNPSELQTNKRDSIVNGITFLVDDKGTIVKTKNILREIYLNEGELYKEDNFVKTNQQLGRLDIYKFISIKSTADTTGSNNLINFEIRLTPKKRMVIGGDIELNNSNYTGQNRNTTLLGTALNLNFQNRNFRNRASTFLLRGNSGIELDFGNPDDILFSIDLLLQGDLDIPEFREFPKVTGFLNWTGLINDRFYELAKEKGQTRVSLGYNRLLLFGFYSYHSFNMYYGYDVQESKAKRIIWNQAGINYLTPQFEARFEEIRDSNLFIKNSFAEQLFTGFLFRDIKYNYTGQSNIFGASWKFIGDFEQSGAEVLFANYAYNGFNLKDEFRLFNDVEFSQYIRLNLDLRFYRNMRRNSTLALRFATGIARPFGFTKEVPYVKQFYAGGPFGNRAWRIRELGPGGYPDPNINDDSQIFYQAGDLKIEFNAEYRFDIIGRVKGALFVDGGNIWTVEEDLDRPGSQFLFGPKVGVDNTEAFWRQFGIGVGVGFRFDFSYFIIGLDLGVKARNPFPDEKGDYWLFNEWPKYQLGDINPNLMIGFPF
jgi:outer membrane protein assembly factor BamA